MCELFGMASLWPTNVRMSLEEFSRHGGLTGSHKDGWGIAYFDHHDVTIFREAESASTSAYVRFLQQHPPASSLVISHIRKATQGARTLENCQPFSRELGGRMQVFAHNGNLDTSGWTQTPHDIYRPIGDTDSERAFCALLNQMQPAWSTSPPVPSLDARMEVVVRFAASIRALGPANFIYSDGDAMFVHGDRRTQADGRGILPPGLHVLCRTCAGDARPIEIDGLTIDGSDPTQHVVLVASVPLTPEPGWQPLGQGEVVALRQGAIARRA